MKKWIKYTFLSLFLLLTVGGKFYSKPSTKVFSTANKSINFKTENNVLFSNTIQDINFNDFFVELDEEDNIHSENFTDFFFENDFYNNTNSIFDHHFVKNKTEFKNRKSFHLPSKIYILIRNIRI